MIKLILVLIGLAMFTFSVFYMKKLAYRNKYCMVKPTLAVLSFAGLGAFIVFSIILSLFLAVDAISIGFIVFGGVLAILCYLFMHSDECKGDGGIGFGFIAIVGMFIGILVLIYGCVISYIL